MYFYYIILSCHFVSKLSMITNCSAKFIPSELVCKSALPFSLQVIIYLTVILHLTYSERYALWMHDGVLHPGFACLYHPINLKLC